MDQIELSVIVRVGKKKFSHMHNNCAEHGLKFKEMDVPNVIRGVNEYGMYRIEKFSYSYSLKINITHILS